MGVAGIAVVSATVAEAGAAQFVHEILHPSLIVQPDEQLLSQLQRPFQS
jgi:hypothetical protein